MRLTRRILVAFAVSLLLCAAATPRAWADDNSGGGGSKSIFGHIVDAAKAAPGKVVDAGKAVVDKAWPGDTPQAKVLSVVDGQSPFSPVPNVPQVVEFAKDFTAAELNGADQVGRVLSPTYASASDTVGSVSRGANGIIDKVPGGWRTVGGAGLVIVVLILFKLLAPPAAQAGKAYVTGGVSTRVPSSLGGSKPSKPRPAPRTQTRHRPVAAPKATWGHSGQYGKADVISADRTRLVFCADSEDHAMTAARKRWQGWRVRTVFCVPCDVNPDKVHAHVKKTTTTMKAKR